jgi:acyl-coenzyme A synthetase/AMP-(fatty) acid ligase
VAHPAAHAVPNGGAGSEVSGRRYFRSGDLVRRTPDGRIVLEGRDDFQVKVRGVAVNTADVERVLLDHPQVAEAAVVAVADAVAGKRLHAVVRRTGAERLNSLVLRQHLAGQLVTAAIPSTFRIDDEPLPKTSTGKVDRKTVAHALAGANQQGE